jgi:DNA-binding transcriptional regulator GbsR (MarR family)
MAKWGKWRRQDITLRVLGALAGATEQDRVLGFNDLSKEAKMSKKTLACYLPTLLDQGLATFMLVGKRKRYFVTPRGALNKKALEHEQQLKTSFSFADLDILLFKNAAPDTDGTVAVHGLTEQKEKAVKALTIGFAKKLKEVVEDSRTRVMLSFNYPSEPLKEE